MYTYQAYVGSVISRYTARKLTGRRRFLLSSLQEIGNVKLVGSLSLGLGMATDLVIAVSLCYFLGGLRTGHRK